MNPAVTANTKIDRVMRTFKNVQASASGELPTTIELLKAGTWRTPYHGDFMITPDDLQEYVDHFTKGIGLVGAGIGAPIDFSHDNHREAAGWIKSLSVVEDTLYGTIEWSVAGEAALKGGLYKCFSPEFYPKGRGGWVDSEDYDNMVENVLTGGGLTNIPLFKDLKPIMASEHGGNAEQNNRYDDMIFIKASGNGKELHMPTLEEILAKDPSALTEEDKAVLVENKGALSNEQRDKFGFERADGETPVTPVETNNNEEEGKESIVAETTNTTQEASQPIQASAVKGDEGNVVVAAAEIVALRAKAQDSEVLASRVETLEASVRASAEKEVKAEMTKHVERGAIKADQADVWATKIMADASMREMLEAIPSNKLLEGEQGSSVKASNATTAVDEVRAKVEEKIKASRENGANELTTLAATQAVMSENAELAEAYNQELKG